jgi:hypothetical protein
MRSPNIPVIIMLIFLTGNLSGQSVRDDPPPVRERIFFAGNVGLQFGTFTNIELSPSIGYWILPRLSLAMGPTYQFYKDPLGKTDLWGPRIYTQFLIIRDLTKVIPVGIGGSICSHMEYEGLSLRRDFWQSYTETGRFYVNTFLAGFGFNQPVSQRSFMTLTVLWTLTDSGYDLYSNPEIRIGFMF